MAGVSSAEQWGCGASSGGVVDRGSGIPRLHTRDASGGEDDQRPLSVLRERYARGEISDDEFDRRREQLERAG
ncbi:MAG: SHOCT domain-containing protein [Natronomonas sp.]